MHSLKTIGIKAFGFQLRLPILLFLLVAALLPISMQFFLLRQALATEYWGAGFRLTALWWTSVYLTTQLDYTGRLDPHQQHLVAA